MEIKNETRLTYEILTDVMISKKTYIITSWSISFFCVFIIEMTIWPSGAFPWWVNLLLGGIFLAFYRLLSKITTPKRLKKTYKKIIGEGESRHSFLFKDEEVECHVSNEVTPEAHAIYPYSSLTGWEFVKNYLVLYVSKYQQITIDLNGFDSEEDKNAVIALLKDKVKKS
ncbi:MAG: YcxB family protein [Paludibacteraceae bacterium]|nr:YcxB family protein [Paludibacteraceae bacterium]